MTYKLLLCFLFANSLFAQNMEDVDSNIKKQESKLHKLGKSASFKVDDIHITRYFVVDNCYLGISNSYSKDQVIFNMEEGPIDLRDVSTMQISDLQKEYSVFEMRFDNKNPRLLFENAKERFKAQKILTQLISLCKYRESINGNSTQHEQVELKVPSSDDVMARPVRSYKETTPIKGALLDGQKSFAYRLKIAKEAKKEGDSLLVQTLIFMADEAGIRISDELISRKQEGVRVELIIDALSPVADFRDFAVHDNTKKMYRNLMAAGIPVYGYRCDGHHLWDEIKLGHRIKTFVIDQRPHEKLWIVNGKKVILGGMNIGNDYFRLNKPGPDYWRDQDMLLIGDEIVQDVVNIFEGNADSFRKNYLDPREDSCFNPYHPINQGMEYQKFYHANRQQYKIHRNREMRQDTQAHAVDLVRKLERAVRDHEPEMQASYERISEIRVVHNRPKLKELAIEDVYIELIRNSKEEILIENAYLIPSPPVKQALIDAAHRGVKVKIITNGYETNDIPPAAVFARSQYRDLLDPTLGLPQEIEIWEWVGTSNKLQIPEQGMNHSKFMVVDRKLVFVGSYNLDPRSREIDSEIGVVFKGQHDKLAKSLGEEFHNSDLKFCKRVTYTQALFYRKPIGFIKALMLKKQGFQLESLDQLVKENFFFKIASYKKDTW